MMKPDNTFDKAVLDALVKLHEEIIKSPEIDMIPPTTDPDKIGSALLSALSKHPLFGTEINAENFNSRILPNAFVTTMVSPRILRRSGPQRTLQWLYKLHDASVYERRTCGELVGVHTDSIISFLNGVSLFPIEQMRDSHMANLIWASQHRGLADPKPAASGLVRITSEQVGNDIKSSNYKDFVDISLGLTIGTLGAPVVGTCWDEYEDEDFELSRIAHGYEYDQFDGKPPRFQSHELTSEAFNWTNKFLGLSGPVRNACTIAATKLNLAQRRMDPGDSAIEISTALESLLATRDERSEMTYRFKLRAALLLGMDLEEKKDISRYISRLYQLRGKVVHGDTYSVTDSDAADVKNWGIDVTRKLLRLIVKRGRLPSFSILELTADVEQAFLSV